MRGLTYRLVAWLMATIATATADGATAGPCGPEGGETAIIAAVGTDFSLKLADGRLLRIAGIDLPLATPDGSDQMDVARTTLASWLNGRSATIRVLNAATDRWGRLPAVVFATPPAGGEIASVALQMVVRGLARGRPEPGFTSCWPAVLGAEGNARQSMLGLWSDPYYAVRRADDGPSLALAAGHMVIAEGRVSHVGLTRERLYVDLGPGRDSLALRLDRRTAFILGQREAGHSSWVGRWIRVRGTLDDRDEPRIDVSDPDQIEGLDGLLSQ